MGAADELDGYEPDKLGEWSERKIAIVSKYAAAYANILVGQRLKHFYIDGFAGGPIALRKETGEQIATTARRILEIEPAFAGYHLVDADAGKVAAMASACAGRPPGSRCADGSPVPAAAAAGAPTAVVEGTRAMSEKAQNVQDVFLGHLRARKMPVTVFLMNGVKLQGIIDSFDRFSVVLRRDRHSQLVYKSTISTIMPTMAVELLGSEKSLQQGKATLSLRS
jgi:host factor-I protein